MNRPALICLLLLAITCQLAASGLTLYSYVDELGQTIVVDSLERIPEQYRDHAKRGFIPAFRSSPKPEKTAPAALIETVPDSIIIRQTEPAAADERFTVSAPPDEVEVETGLASAAMTMEQLRLIHLNNERIYIAVRDNGIQFPGVGQLYLINGQLIVDFTLPGEMSTEPGKTWLNQARNLYEQLRGLQVNIAGWLSTSSPELPAAMPTLLSRAKGMLNELETAFSAIPAGQ